MLLFLSAASLAVCMIAVATADEQHGHLWIIDVGDNSLEAIFYTVETGIRIVADSNSLTLMSMSSGEILLSGNRPHDSSFSRGKFVSPVHN